MVDFKVVLSDPKNGMSYKIDATGGASGAFIGKEIGDEVIGDPLGFPGYTLMITGGTDKTGIPARKDLPGPNRRRLLLSDSTGFNAVEDGQRRRKTVRGREITTDFVQINAKVVGYGDKDLKDYFAPPAEEGAAE
jgi:small subunit ribosomal protein S6e